MESRNRDKVVTSPADYSSAECNLFARRDVESLGRWAADNAKHKIQTLVFILLSLLVNIRNYPLSSLHLVTLCLSPKNGKHTFSPFPRIPPAFFGSQVTATVTGPATRCRTTSCFDRLRPARPFAMLSTRMLSPSVSSLPILTDLIYNASCSHSSLEAPLPLRAPLFSDQLDL